MDKIYGAEGADGSETHRELRAQGYIREREPFFVFQLDRTSAATVALAVALGYLTVFYLLDLPWVRDLPVSGLAALTHAHTHTHTRTHTHTHVHVLAAWLPGAHGGVVAAACRSVVVHPDPPGSRSLLDARLSQGPSLELCFMPRQGLPASLLASLCVFVCLYVTVSIFLSHTHAHSLSLARSLSRSPSLPPSLLLPSHVRLGGRLARRANRPSQRGSSSTTSR